MHLIHNKHNIQMQIRLQVKSCKLSYLFVSHKVSAEILKDSIILTDLHIKI